MSTRFGVLLFALLCVALAGCGSEDAVGLPPAAAIGAACEDGAACGFFGAECLDDLPGGYCTIGCGGASDCPAGTACVTFAGGAVCAATCDGDADCRNGYLCQQAGDLGVCNTAGGTGGGGGGDSDAGGVDGGTLDVGLPGDVGVDPGEPNYGVRCQAADSCVAGGGLSPRCLSDAQGFTGGYCSAACTPGIDDCGAGGVCVTTSIGGLCMAGCEAAPDCRSGYGCCAEDGGDACLPAALRPECVEGPGPDPDPDPDPDPTGGEVGAPCGGDGDCGAGSAPQCFRQIPGGYCTSSCESDADCGAGAFCGDFGIGPPLCVRGCASADACFDGQECCDPIGAGPACLPSLLCGF